jgi:PAS domain S-box-containing protein
MNDFETASIHRQIVEDSYDAIVFADTEGIIRLWNAGAELIFGFSAQEVLGRSLDLIIPEKNRRAHWEGYRRVMESGETSYYGRMLAVPALRKDGSRVSIEFSIVVVRSPDGKPAGSAAIIRDVSQRREQERALKSRIAELESSPGSKKPAVGGGNI